MKITKAKIEPNPTTGKNKNKVLLLPLDFTELPERYFFNNQESLSENKFVDDNSLFVYYLISRGIFSVDSKAKRDSGAIFLFYHPFEWTSIDFISFLLSVSNKYNLNIENIETYIGAVEDEYEISDEPRQYKGAYKWILELREKEPNREEAVLFNKFFTDTASVSDIERALIYAERIAPVYKDEKSELYLSKDIFRKILDYTSFSFALNSVKKSKIKDDVGSYIEAFMQGKLFRNNESKRIGNTSVIQSKNIFTFEKHSLLFREYLHKMQDDFGNIVIIENTFEKRFPNISYPEAEVIRNRYSERNFFFLHILFAFQKQGLIKFLSLGSSWSIYEDEMLTYQAKIEILPAFFNEDLSKKLYFDKDKSRFYVQGKEIKLLKFKDEYHTLRIMFENPSDLPQEWFFSEIVERTESKSDDKKYYNAIYQLRIKLEKQGIKDFFITTKQSVKINKKYLS
ncbi:MAG: hypothetical protein WC788_04430 [Candidatus Paceibacterota bacterium]|jgi:hypothetical protein